MIRNIVFSVIGFIALAAPAMAQEQCAAPVAPAIPGGARATSGQIMSAQNDIKVFATASDNYQACIVREIARQKDLAKQNNVAFDPNIQTELETKAAAQKKDVERLATAWGAAVQAFNAAQQRKQRPSDPLSRSAGGGGYGSGNGY
jgi:hypothetical protein